MPIPREEKKTVFILSFFSSVGKRAERELFLKKCPLTTTTNMTGKQIPLANKRHSDPWNRAHLASVDNLTFTRIYKRQRLTELVSKQRKAHLVPCLFFAP
jgi:hypothetical protein